MGFIISRELGRSLDSVRIRKDEKGHTENWLKSESLKRFDNNVKCWRKKITGTRFLNEMLADHVGHEASFMALKKWEKEMNGTIVEKIRGYESMTMEQIFFHLQALVRVKKKRN